MVLIPMIGKWVCISTLVLVFSLPLATSALFVVRGTNSIRKHSSQQQQQPHRGSSKNNPNYRRGIQHGRISTAAAAAEAASSWETIECSFFNDIVSTENPISIDSVLDPNPPKFSKERPTFFRERHGWCPYSERVWLILEYLNVDYDTIRIDNTGGPKPSYYRGGQTPQMVWPEDGKWQSESMDLVEELIHRYATDEDMTHKMISEEAKYYVSCFRNIFPSKARPSSRAAFLFQWNGEPLFRNVFQKTLQETDALLGAKQKDGPFFCGNQFTIADIAWVPFLERYRYQLPCLHAGLQPDDPMAYPNLSKWYDAMDQQIPSYACRVSGDASSWRKVLTMAGFGNAGIPPTIEQTMDEIQQKEISKVLRTNNKEVVKQQQKLWDEYISTRPYMAKTPHEQAARIITQNRKAIKKDIIKNGKSLLPLDEKEIDQTLRELVIVLCTIHKEDTMEIPKYVRALALFLDGRMCVPRDMGAMSAAYIKKIASVSS